MTMMCFEGMPLRMSPMSVLMSQPRWRERFVPVEREEAGGLEHAVVVVGAADVAAVAGVVEQEGAVLLVAEALSKALDRLLEVLGRRGAVDPLASLRLVDHEDDVLLGVAVVAHEQVAHRAGRRGRGT